jgi:hypothetical protein
VLLISTHANPIGFPSMPRDEVLCRNGAFREKIHTSPMLLKKYQCHRSIMSIIFFTKLEP